MEPSSRTPEGRFNHCPVCGKEVHLDPSIPPGDAPCPHCGHLIWFDPGEAESAEETPVPNIDAIFRHAVQTLQKTEYERAADRFLLCILSDPCNLDYVRPFFDALYKYFGGARSLGLSLQPMKAETEEHIERAIAISDWDSVITEGLLVLRVDPWNAAILRQMAAACEQLAARGIEPKSSRYSECARFYQQCAELAAQPS